ncbi:MAG: hypothetical protein ABSA46_11595 [Thermodesulfovibrionales bacterium]
MEAARTLKWPVFAGSHAKVLFGMTSFSDLDNLDFRHMREMMQES